MIQAEPLAYLLGVLLLLTLPIDWIVSVLCAAIFHELCHIGLVYLLGGKVHGLQIGINGARIEAELDGALREAICVLAGPLGSMLLTIAFCKALPKLAICAGVQCIFNLLPIYPLDGGRLLNILLMKFVPKHAESFQQKVELGTILMLSMGLITLSVHYSMGLSPMLLSLIMGIKWIRRKRPCKQTENTVQ